MTFSGEENSLYRFRLKAVFGNLTDLSLGLKSVKKLYRDPDFRIMFKTTLVVLNGEGR